MLMHLQTVGRADYDVFARALTIGPETMVMKFQPDEPMHNRYAVDARLPVAAGAGARRSPSPRPSTRSSGGSSTPARCSCKDGVVYPIDYANACPDVAVTSLHYYFPWAMTALLKWSAFCVATGRKARTQVDTGAVVRGRRRPGAGLRGQARGVPAAGRRRTSTPSATRSSARSPCRDIDEMVLDWVQSPEFDAAAGQHRRHDLPAARARAVPGPLPRAARPLGRRRATPGSAPDPAGAHPGPARSDPAPARPPTRPTDPARRPAQRPIFVPAARRPGRRGSGFYADSPRHEVGSVSWVCHMGLLHGSEIWSAR